MAKIFPGGTSVAKVFPASLSGGGGGSKVAPIDLNLTPSAATVAITDGLVTEGLLKGWKVSDPQSGIASLADDGSEFTVKIQATTSNYEWLGTSGVAEKQPIIYYPTPLMGDFTFEVKFTGASSGNAYRMIFIGGFALPSGAVGDTPNWSHHFGCRFGRWNASDGKPTAGFSTSNGKTTADITNQDWDQDNWLKLQRSGETITASHKYGGGAYATITAADKWDIGGGATNIGIGFMTRGADGGSEDDIDLLSVSLRGYDWTDDP